MLRFFQDKSYQKSILIFQKGNLVPKNSKILSLYPTFTDKLLRVGGCLKSTELLLKYHSQIIINKNQPSAALVIKYHHEDNFGRKQTL